jgi:glycosyltransferase involved in cell wall biosynthesis
MARVKVLHIGIKNWPYDYAFSQENLVGIRGGGINKYCDMLINAFPCEVETFIITQKLKGQNKFELKDKISIWRVPTFGKRALRQIVGNIVSFFYAISIIRKNKIDIIHGHMIHGIIISFLLAKIFGKKVIGVPYSVSTKHDKSSLDGLAKVLESVFYKRLDCLVFESNESRQKAEEFRSMKFSNDIVIHTGCIIPHNFVIKQELKKPLKFLFIGRIIKIKAIDKLILSLKHLESQILEQIHIDIIGEGEMFERNKQLIDSNNLSAYITMHGFVENIEPFIINGDVFVLPSDMEGFSISLIEAMSYGKACIVNNLGVPFDETEVYTMKNNDPKEIAASIRYFINNVDLIPQLGINARTSIINRFSVSAFANNYYKLYESLM